MKTLALLLLLAIPAHAELAIVFTPSELVDQRSPEVRQQAAADRAFQLRMVPMRANGRCPRGSRIEPTYKTYCLQAK